MAPPAPLIVFTPSGRRGRFSEGTDLLTAARRLGVDLDSVCGGRALCGRCQVTIAEGRFAKHGIDSGRAHVTAPTAAEERYAARRGLAEGRRLACQARITGDLVIDVPAESQVHRQLVRKPAEAREIALDPVVRPHFVEVDPAGMEDRGDLERLTTALAAQWGLRVSRPDLPLLRRLQTAIRDGRGAVTVAVREAREIVALFPGFHERVFGAAIDIGSTTIAAHLCDLGSGRLLASAGAMNPQIRFGEDLMSRASYAMTHPGGAVEMTEAVRGAVSTLIGELAREAGIDPAGILELVVVGNPMMHHLFLGLDPTPLGTAPFTLATAGPLDVRAAELGIGSVGEGARLHLLPCIAGHVGADCAAAILAEGPHLREEITLLVDVGTNAELVLGNRERLLACSSPTGPAFEGAQISCGQRAAPGAIERVRIDRETLEPRFRVIGCELWSDEPGFAEAVRKTGITGICGSGIIEVLAEMYLAGILAADGTIRGELAARSPRIRAEERTFAYLLHEGEPEIRITQTDVRAIQLAKAALYAGARLLMDRAGSERVDRVVLAGAFGSHIDPLRAMVLGMIPDCPLERVTSAGNAAGTGARIALLNRAARAEVAALVHRIEKVETALEPRFQEHFVGAMAFPHATAPFPLLGKTVRLPTGTGGTRTSVRRRRRRRPA